MYLFRTDWNNRGASKALQSASRTVGAGQIVLLIWGFLVASFCVLIWEEVLLLLSSLKSQNFALPGTFFLLIYPLDEIAVISNVFYTFDLLKYWLSSCSFPLPSLITSCCLNNRYYGLCPHFFSVWLNNFHYCYLSYYQSYPCSFWKR